jgi:hypothetical protein
LLFCSKSTSWTSGAGCKLYSSVCQVKVLKREGDAGCVVGFRCPLVGTDCHRVSHGLIRGLSGFAA